MILHQFAISHYCEKARWALDHKGINYQIKNYFPGSHIKKIRAIAADTLVPVLQHKDEVIQGSDQIITWLDTIYPENNLTPHSKKSKEQSLAWEHYIDEEIGIHLRRYLYHYLLERPDILIPMLTTGRPWYEKYFVKLKYKDVNRLFRKYLNINHKTAEESLQRLTVATKKLDGAYKESKYLVDKCFTRADLSAAAMLAPLARVDKYGIDWPEKPPVEILETEEALRPTLTWVTELYNRHRVS